MNPRKFAQLVCSHKKHEYSISSSFASFPAVQTRSVFINRSSLLMFVTLFPPAKCSEEFVNEFQSKRCFRAARDILVGRRACKCKSYGLWNQGACFAYWLFLSRWIICRYSRRSSTRHFKQRFMNRTRRSVTIFRVIATWYLHIEQRRKQHWPDVISALDAERIGKWMIYLHFTLSHEEKKCCTSSGR